MDPNRNRGPRAARPAAERSLQPDDWTSASAPPTWLGDADAYSEAEDVDRLVGDADMLLQLQLTGYEGEAWRFFSDVLARYGYAVLLSWLSRGVMLQRCREKGLRGLPEDGLIRRAQQEPEELAGETVAVAI